MQNTSYEILKDQNAEFIEEARVLGAIIQGGNEFFDRSLDKLSAKDFKSSQNFIIYKTAHEIFSNSEEINQFTILAYLQKQKQLEAAGGYESIQSLIENSYNLAFFEEYASRLKNQNDSNFLMSQAQKMMISLAKKRGNPLQIAQEFIQNISSLEGGVEKRGFDLREAQVDRIDEIIEGNQERLIPTGFPIIDNEFAMMLPGALTILGADSGTGKTAFAIQILDFLSKNGYPPAYNSTEMSKEQLSDRLISLESFYENNPIEYRKFTLPDMELTESEKQTFLDMRSKLNFFPIEVANIYDLDELVAWIRFLYRKGVRVFFIDHLQHLTAGSGYKFSTRDQELGIITKVLKKLCIDLRISIVCLSQLNQKEKGNPEGFPSIRHLRDSGHIRQDADIVTFLTYPYQFQAGGIEDFYITSEKVRQGKTRTKADPIYLNTKRPYNYFCEPPFSSQINFEPNF